MKNYFCNIFENVRNWLMPTTINKSLVEIDERLHEFSLEIKLLQSDLIELRGLLDASQEKIRNFEILMSEKNDLSLKNENVDLLLMECIGEIAKHVDSLDKSFAAISGGKNTIVVGLKNDADSRK